MKIVIGLLCLLLVIWWVYKMSVHDWDQKCPVDPDCPFGGDDE